jgi:hypothetical protein
LKQRAHWAKEALQAKAETSIHRMKLLSILFGLDSIELFEVVETPIALCQNPAL